MPDSLNTVAASSGLESQLEWGGIIGIIGVLLAIVSIVGNAFWKPERKPANKAQASATIAAVLLFLVAIALFIEGGSLENITTLLGFIIFAALYALVNAAYLTHSHPEALGIKTAQSEMDRINGEMFCLLKELTCAPVKPANRVAKNCLNYINDLAADIRTMTGSSLSCKEVVAYVSRNSANHLLLARPRSCLTTDQYTTVLACGVADPSVMHIAIVNTVPLSMWQLGETKKSPVAKKAEEYFDDQAKMKQKRRGDKEAESMGICRYMALEEADAAALPDVDWKAREIDVDAKTWPKDWVRFHSMHVDRKIALYIFRRSALDVQHRKSLEDCTVFYEDSGAGWRVAADLFVIEPYKQDDSKAEDHTTGSGSESKAGAKATEDEAVGPKPASKADAMAVDAPAKRGASRIKRTVAEPTLMFAATIYTDLGSNYSDVMKNIQRHALKLKDTGDGDDIMTAEFRSDAGLEPAPD